MIVAFGTTVTLLPALLAVLKPPGEPDHGYAALGAGRPLSRNATHMGCGHDVGGQILGLPLLTARISTSTRSTCGPATLNQLQPCSI